jgi:cytoskeleton protein RodZ
MSDLASKVPAEVTPQIGGVAAGAATAGALLRAARQAQGLHVAALAASIKVPQRKLESLEADRYDELPDMTFTRALAKTVCRSLKIDAAPVLALLPQLDRRGLDRVHQGLNTTFRERPSRLEPTDLGVLTRPAVWVPLLLVLVAAALYWLPQSWIAGARPPPPVVAPAASPPPAPASAATVAAAMTPPAAESSVPAFPPEAASLTTPAPAELSGTLQLRTSGESWVEIVDASGASLLHRMLQPGEAVGLDGTPPFKVKIGNATVTTLIYRGQPVELAASTRDNVARFELK